MPRQFNLINPNEPELLPYRTTKAAAGYDLMSSEDIIVPANTNKPTVVHTGVTVTMHPDECLMLANRSSNGTKRFIQNPNGIGIVDADYTDEILMPFINFGDDDYHIKRGDRIAQGIFMPVFTTDNDVQTNHTRNGGFGSTGN